MGRQFSQGYAALGPQSPTPSAHRPAEGPVTRTRRPADPASTRGFVPRAARLRAAATRGRGRAGGSRRGLVSFLRPLLLPRPKLAASATLGSARSARDCSWRRPGGGGISGLGGLGVYFSFGASFPGQRLEAQPWCLLAPGSGGCCWMEQGEEGHHSLAGRRGGWEPERAWAGAARQERRPGHNVPGPLGPVVSSEQGGSKESDSTNVQFRKVIPVSTEVRV